jgi:hypothetical protein
MKKLKRYTTTLLYPILLCLSKTTPLHFLEETRRMGACNSTPSPEELRRERSLIQAQKVINCLYDMFEEMAKLREDVHPKDHTPKILSNLRTAVLKHGKDIMELGGKSYLRAFWELIENVDEGVAERITTTEAKRGKMTTFPLERLPSDLITSVCQYLDADTLMSLSQTSHKYQKMAHDPLMWKYAMLTIYKDLPRGYNEKIDERGGRDLLDRVQRVHIESAYPVNEENAFVRDQEHYRYKVFAWNLSREALPLRELVCPWRLVSRVLLDAIKNTSTQLEVLRFTGTGVVYGSYFGHELEIIMAAHKDSLRELDAIPSLPLHVYYEKDDRGRMGETEKICDGLRSLVHLEKVSLPLARIRSLTMMFFGMIGYSNANFRDLPQLKDEIPSLDREIANELSVAELVKGANRELVTAARSLPALRDVLYVLHTKGSVVDTIAETLEMYLDDGPEQEELRVIRFEQRPEDPQISINSHDDTPNMLKRASNEDLNNIDKEVLELFGDDPIGNMQKYTAWLLETATAKFITAACNFFKRYPDVHLKIQLQGDYWNKLYEEVVLSKIPVEFHSRLSLE